MNDTALGVAIGLAAVAVVVLAILVLAAIGDVAFGVNP